MISHRRRAAHCPKCYVTIPEGLSQCPRCNSASAQQAASSDAVAMPGGITPFVVEAAGAARPSADEIARYQLGHRARNGANWFYWIAGLSLVNSIAHFAGTAWGFIAGLGIAQVIDAILRNASTTLRGVGFVLDIGVALVFVGMGALAHKQRAGWIIGMTLYSFDTLIFLLVREWIGLAFHAYVLFSIGAGYKAFKALSALTPVEPTTDPGLPEPMVAAAEPIQP